GPASAGPITTFLDQPTSLSALESNGSAIFADDFVPAHTGWLHHAIWWGSRAPIDSQWVIAFYANTAGQPSGDNPVTDALVTFEFSGDDSFQESNYGLGPDAEIWRFVIGLPEVLELIAGNEYWFSVTNLAPGWKWAEADNAPTVGTENFNAHVTDRTELPGPDCIAVGNPPLCYGPWVDTHANFAFQIVVPEPSSAFLAGLALALLAFARRSKSGCAVEIKTGSLPWRASGRMGRQPQR
ncbi:MAG: PEP-CTERM sorting domain-containing protein, partial [Rhizobacter sp.]